METYIISKAHPNWGELVKRAAAGNVIYLLNGKHMVALVPARPAHDVPGGLNEEEVNGRLATSEKTITTTWEEGDAGRLARKILGRKRNK
jgi:hypothetical protein